MCVGGGYGFAMRSPRFPAWVAYPLLAGLTAASLSTYLAGDWRNGDVSLYHAYALGFWGGLPHPLLPTEYPPLSVVPFALSLAGPAAWYPDVFAFWTGVAAVLGYLAFRRWTSPAQAGAYVLYALGAGAATLVFRFDIFPALLTVGALWLAQRERFTPAYLLLGLATLLKLFPLALLPVMAIAQWRVTRSKDRGAWKLVAFSVCGCLAIVVVGFGVAALIDPKEWSSSLKVELQRPIEVESVPATLMWLGSLVGIADSPVVSFDAFNITGVMSTPLEVLAAAAMAGGVLWIVWSQVRGRFTVGQAATACVLVLVCTSKVLSPQYLIWVAPILATTVGFKLRWFAVFLLTALVFPTLFEVAVTSTSAGARYGPLVLAGVAIRNTLLLVLTARFLLAPGTDLAFVNPIAGEHLP